eukprot:CAMPEP_0203774922 /NCGR_PEP_ID=MMETSP0099_2-20121227/5694_1 /ASSEMBLY_ACC=CAM_ASM_000209 /TAXON_ID=96639 /ORGANISM=" , Strain NY0313808BC1" /LENGTH=183 /DNA_ID=CAMNT_0050673341 /DNA_START=146 /DNA_END=693 /DNA_ORIENTATION=+
MMKGWQAWIKTVPFENATGKLAKLYQRVTGPNQNVDNIMMVHSLRPHSMEGHMLLYKNCIHHTGNTLEKHWLEAIGVYVSHLNKCEYCVEHHFMGYKRLIDNDNRSALVRRALESGKLEQAFDDKQQTLFHYAKKLTLDPSSCTKQDVEMMQAAGYDDGQILEVNQVTAYFNYANRTVLGLGV